jgi:uncharacterized protein YbjQ (UPF0145 family)
VYEARSLAVQALRSEAKRLGATGVIGLDLSRSLAEHEGSLVEMSVTVHLLGTAIRRRSRGQLDPGLRVGLGVAS